MLLQLMQIYKLGVYETNYFRFYGLPTKYFLFLQKIRIFRLIKPFMKSISFRLTPRNSYFVLAAIAAVTLLPFLGEALFYSKGEPREAIVAVSMLNSGDWILPESNGDEIPYKPPFMAWCIAILSLIHGHVTEYLSRLPSALALIGMILWCYGFFKRRISWTHAFAAGIITLTAFEAYRAGMACRVDMLLTFFITGALFSLYTHWERGLKGLPWLAILMMSGGVLTKGPVAIVLPIAVIFTFMLLRGERFLRVVAKLILPVLVPLLIPLLWYYAAYLQESSEFIDLVHEENIERMTGTMSYASHVKPLYYNFITLLSGYLPYTLLLLLSIIPMRRINAIKSASPIKKWWTSFKSMDAPRMFALVTILLIFVFYCIPKSKRSVYLLPIYPFIAVFVADYIAWLIRRGHRSIKIYGAVLASVVALAFAAFVIIQCGWFPYSLLSGRHALDNAVMITGLEGHISIIKWLLIEVSAILAVITLWKLRKASPKTAFIMTLAVTITFYWAFAGAYQPGILNAKSDRIIATTVNRIQPRGNIYAHVEMPMLHFYSANYYTNDRIKPFSMSGDAKSGYLLVGVEDARKFLPEQAGTYDFYLIKHFKKRSADIRQPILLLKFIKKE